MSAQQVNWQPGATPAPLSAETRATIKFIRKKLDEQIAKVRAENTANASPPVVNVTLDVAELAEIIGGAVERMGEVVAAALQNRPRRTLRIEHGDSSSVIREE
jgi:hypothetical protein